MSTAHRPRPPVLPKKVDGVQTKSLPGTRVHQQLSPTGGTSAHSQATFGTSARNGPSKEILKSDAGYDRNLGEWAVVANATGVSGTIASAREEVRQYTSQHASAWDQPRYDRTGTFEGTMPTSKTKIRHVETPLLIECIKTRNWKRCVLRRMSMLVVFLSSSCGS